jgi:hypothetical protein
LDQATKKPKTKEGIFMEQQKIVTGAHPVLGNPNAPNPFAASGLFQSTTDVWTPLKLSLEGFAGTGKTLTMLLILLGIWHEEGKNKIVCLQDTEKSAKFITPFLRHYGLIEGKNLFVTPSRSLIDFGKILDLCNREHGLFMTDTVTHLWDEMLRQFTVEQERPVKYPGDAMILKPEWKKQFTTPFVDAQNCHLFFTGRAAWEYTMELNEETKKKEFNATGVKMVGGGNELAYEPDIVVLMERVQEIRRKGVVTCRRASILKDRSRLIDGQQFSFEPQNPGRGKQWDFEPVWSLFRPVWKYLAAGNAVEAKNVPEPTPMGQLFSRGNAEGYWQRCRQVDVLIEEIDGVYQQWIPGSGGMEKQLKSIIFNLQFNTRSKSALAERTPGELKQGLDCIEYLSRYVAKNYELLEKMYDKGDYENVTSFLTEEKNRFDKGETAAPAPAAAPVDDDQIPEFGSAAASSPAPDLAAKAAEAPSNPAEICQALTNAETAAKLFELEQIFAPVIAAMAQVDRDQVDWAAKQRRLDLSVLLAEAKGKKGSKNKKARAASNGKSDQQAVA